MRERAEELGGRYSIVTPSSGGCRVRAVLPLETPGPERHFERESEDD